MLATETQALVETAAETAEPKEENVIRGTRCIFSSSFYERHDQKHDGKEEVR